MTSLNHLLLLFTVSVFFSTLFTEVQSRLTATEWLHIQDSEQQQQQQQQQQLLLQQQPENLKDNFKTQKDQSQESEGFQWLDQDLDHFSPFSKTFKQRFWLSETYWVGDRSDTKRKDYKDEKKVQKQNDVINNINIKIEVKENLWDTIFDSLPSSIKSFIGLSSVTEMQTPLKKSPLRGEKGMVLLYICGESICHPPLISDESTNLMSRLAREHKASVVTLEHRFYGFSTPKEFDWSQQSLIHLSHYQALADLATFIERFIHRRYGKDNVLVYTVGGSYPGALSAWMKSKYPNLVHGSLASSGVVQAISDFQMFDYQIGMSAKAHGKNCFNVLGQINSYMDDLYESSQQSSSSSKEILRIKKYFGRDAVTMPNDEFAWFLSDLFVMDFQYGTGSSFCSEMLRSYEKDNRVLDTTTTFLWIYLSNLKKSFPNQYSVKSLKNTTVDVEKNSRQWTWQYCTYFGWFQTPYEKESVKMRSSLLTYDFWQKYCADIFPELKQLQSNGDFDNYPIVDQVNSFLGGWDQTPRRVIYTNGGEDPWQWATKRHKSNEQQYTLNASCVDCGHCGDLGSEKATDSQVLRDLRQEIIRLFGSWHREY